MQDRVGRPRVAVAGALPVAVVDAEAWVHEIGLTPGPCAQGFAAEAVG